jgi:hypothetical protein
MPLTMPNAEFSIRPITICSGHYRYDRFQVSGWINGRRVRRTARSEAEAQGLKNHLAVDAANSHREPKRLLTRLSDEELFAAEAAVARLGSVPLTTAAEWYLQTWRPPPPAQALAIAAKAFLEDKRPCVCGFVWDGYRRRLDALCAALPGRNVSDITPEALRDHLEAQPRGPKGFNNLRGELSSFLGWCAAEPRRWIEANPAVAIPKMKVARGIPEILSAEKVAELFAYLETYQAPDGPPGCLVPYFALATFAGLRPSSDGGEIVRIGRLKDVSRVIDLELGVIRLRPELSKVKSVRQITIQPNLAAFLRAYPLPITPPNARTMIQRVRQKFALSHDVLRHTFISMHVAKFKSLGSTALEAGGSEIMIHVHYLNLVSEAEAAAFWSIAPASRS